MSVEITLYTKNATKQKLINELLQQGFYRTKSIIGTQNNEEIGFMWFETKNYESFVGVEATVVKSTEEERQKYGCSEWILHTRSRSSGSYKDKEKQNLIIKHCRKLFGGTFYNDWYGTNTYTKLADYPNLSAPERGLSLMRSSIFHKIEGIKFSLNSFPNLTINVDLENSDNKEFVDFLKSIDPSLTIYNAMFPFLVALIEFMFKESFLIMIRYSVEAQSTIETENIKVPLRDVLKVNRGEILIEDIIADSFTFQNLEQVNKAYQKYLGIDIAGILSQKRKIQNKFCRIYQKLIEIISLRHSIIHHLGFYTELDKNQFVYYLKIIEVTLEIFLNHLEKRYQWKFEDIY